MLGLSARSPAVLLFLGRHIVKALRPEKISVGSSPDPPGETQGAAEFRVGIIGRKAVIPGPAFRVEPGSHSDGFQQRGFPAAVLPHKKRDRIPKSDLSHPCQRRNASQIAALFNFIPVDKQAAERQIVDHRQSSRMVSDCRYVLLTAPLYHKRFRSRLLSAIILCVT